MAIKMVMVKYNMIMDHFSKENSNMIKDMDMEKCIIVQEMNMKDFGKII